jgi:hypothetical protein
VGRGSVFAKPVWDGRQQKVLLFLTVDLFAVSDADNLHGQGRIFDLVNDPVTDSHAVVTFVLALHCRNAGWPRVPGKILDRSNDGFLLRSIKTGNVLHCPFKILNLVWHALSLKLQLPDDCCACPILWCAPDPARDDPRRHF